MIRATLYRNKAKRGYLLNVSSGCLDVTYDIGKDRPSCKSIRRLCKPALCEEVLLTDRTLSADVVCTLR